MVARVKFVGFTHVTYRDANGNGQPEDGEITASMDHLKVICLGYVALASTDLTSAREPDSAKLSNAALPLQPEERRLECDVPIPARCPRGPVRAAPSYRRPRFAKCGESIRGADHADAGAGREIRGWRRLLDDAGSNCRAWGVQLFLDAHRLRSKASPAICDLDLEKGVDPRAARAPGTE